MNGAERFISYSQHGEDVILWRAMGSRPSGFYVDVGAFDPTYDSVTRALYERGWRGINIEAQPDRLDAFERERPEDTNLALAIGDRDGTATLTVPGVPGWASIVEPAVTGTDPDTSRATDVPVRRLDTLFAEHGIDHVDVLKIDVEGAEPEVVRGMLDGPVRPTVCVVEGVAPGLGRAAGDEAVRLLESVGYLHCLFDGLNHYLTTDAALVPALALPANPLDEYTPVSVVNLERERAQLHATIAALASENVALRALSTSLAADRAEIPTFSESQALPTSETSDGDGTPELLGSDLPVPADEPQTDDAEAQLAAAPEPAPPVLDADVRARRRRATFVKLLQGERPTLTRTPGSSATRLLKLALVEHTPAESVALLYREILGRQADPDGLAMWARRVEAGEPLLAVAREFASSAEALDRSPEDRARVRSELDTWESLVVVTEMGIASWRPGRTYTPGSIGDQIFVEALFEAAMLPSPTPAQLRHEVDKLRDGVGREWLIRAYAARPEVRERLLGRSDHGVRGWLRGRRNSRGYLDVFRARVTVAEARQVTLIASRLSSSSTETRTLTEAAPNPSKER